MLARSSFWFMFIFNMCLGAIGSTIISCNRDLTMSVGAVKTLAATMVGVFSICNGLSRVISGYIFDMFGRRRTMISAACIAVAAGLVGLLAAKSGSLALMIIAICVTGVTYGFATSILSAGILQLYGRKNFALNFAVGTLNLIPATFAATLAGGMVQSTGSYVMTFVMLTAFAVLSLIMAFVLKKS